MFYKLYPFLYQCDVLRDVEKTKDHANDKSKSVQSPPFPFYWQLTVGGEGEDKTRWSVNWQDVYNAFFQCRLCICRGTFLGPMVPFWILSLSKIFTDYSGKHFDPPSLSPQTGNVQIDDTPFVFGPWAFLTGHEGPFTNIVKKFKLILVKPSVVVK